MVCKGGASPAPTIHRPGRPLHQYSVGDLPEVLAYGVDSFAPTYPGSDGDCLLRLRLAGRFVAVD
jgi:hypothetical protein